MSDPTVGPWERDRVTEVAASNVVSSITTGTADKPYALCVADDSQKWYRKAAIRSRRAYKLSESLLIVIAGGIPVVAVIEPNDALIPAILGASIVVLASLRSVFHWQDNYLRFSRAREAVEAERRLYLTSTTPYDDASTKDQRLVAAVTRIEQEEMGTWLKIAEERPTLAKG